jgi:hypothetical protein
VNIPYHPNVSAEGRVLFSAIDRSYTPRTTVWDLIVATRKLLESPETADALNEAIGREFLASRSVYDGKARASADSVGDVSPDAWPYTAGKKYTDADIAAIDGELDDMPVDQFSITRTRPTPMLIAPDAYDDLYD